MEVIYCLQITPCCFHLQKAKHKSATEKMKTESKQA
ncbi:hypothetical protein T08_13520 [Trichinella sp. T8]|nr:hypothetical protein T08_13520 [Trichinella sp. T8]